VKRPDLKPFDFQVGANVTVLKDIRRPMGTILRKGMTVKIAARFPPLQPDAEVVHVQLENGTIVKDILWPKTVFKP
jgi:hypothetical protein